MLCSSEDTFREVPSLFTLVRGASWTCPLPLRAELRAQVTLGDTDSSQVHALWEQRATQAEQMAPAVIGSGARQGLW